MQKQERCCAKLAHTLRESKRELARLARLEAYHAQVGHNVSNFPALIANQRAVIKTSEKAIIDHEAEHAESYQ